MPFSFFTIGPNLMMSAVRLYAASKPSSFPVHRYRFLLGSSMDREGQRKTRRHEGLDIDETKRRQNQADTKDLTSSSKFSACCVLTLQTISYPTHNHYHPAHYLCLLFCELDDSGCVLTKGRVAQEGFNQLGSSLSCSCLNRLSL